MGVDYLREIELLDAQANLKRLIKSNNFEIGEHVKNTTLCRCFYVTKDNLVIMIVIYQMDVMTVAILNSDKYIFDGLSIAEINRVVCDVLSLEFPLTAFKAEFYDHGEIASWLDWCTFKECVTKSYDMQWYN